MIWNENVVYCRRNNLMSEMVPQGNVFPRYRQSVPFPLRPKPTHMSVLRCITRFEATGSIAYSPKRSHISHSEPASDVLLLAAVEANPRSSRIRRSYVGYISVAIGAINVLHTKNYVLVTPREHYSLSCPSWKH